MPCSGELRSCLCRCPFFGLLALLEERLKAAGAETKLRDERLAEALAGVTERLEQLETFALDLGEINNRGQIVGYAEKRTQRAPPSARF